METVTDNAGRASLAALQRFVRKPREQTELCELCAVPLSPVHQHLLDAAHHLRGDNRDLDPVVGPGLTDSLGKHPLAVVAQQVLGLGQAIFCRRHQLTRQLLEFQRSPC